MHAGCHHHDFENKESKNLALVFFLNFGFAIFEFIGGILSQSVALLSDAIHDMGDALAIALAWWFSKVGQKKRNEKFSYGYKRFSLLSAFIASFILIIGAILMLILSIQKIANPVEVQSKLMIFFAIFGVIINGLAVLKIKTGKTMNEKVISLHLLEDLFGWVTVLVGAIIIHFTGWYLLDPIMAIGISLWILVQGFKKGYQVIQVFLQSVPEEINQKGLLKKLKKIKNIIDIHDLHIWSLDGNNNIGSCHLVIKPKTDTITIKKQVRECFCKNGIQHITIEIEDKKEDCPHLYC